MIRFDFRRGPILQSAVYFAHVDDLRELVRGLALNQVVGGFFCAPAARLSLDLAGRVVWQRQSQTLFVDLTQTPEALLAQMRRNCRYDVRNTAKLGERVAIRRNDAQCRADLLRLERELARHKRLRPQRRAVMRRYLAEGDVFAIYLDGEVACAHLLMTDRTQARVRLMVSASRRFDRGAATTQLAKMNRFLHWHEIELYRAEGIRTYDFGGVNEDDAERANISHFKRGFGGEAAAEMSYVFARPLGALCVRGMARLRSLARRRVEVEARAMADESDVAEFERAG